MFFCRHSNHIHHNCLVNSGAMLLLKRFWEHCNENESAISYLFFKRNNIHNSYLVDFDI